MRIFICAILLTSLTAMEMEKKIDQELRQIATIENGGSGYKAANLIKLKEACKKFNEEHPQFKLKFSVPDFINIPSNFVIEAIDEVYKTNLNQKFLELGKDPEQFAKFLNNLVDKEYKEGSKYFAEPAKIKPSKEKAQVNQEKTYFIEENEFLNKFPIINQLDAKLEGKLKTFLNECNDNGTKLMVRSTGKEDTKEIANAGGNETVANVPPQMVPVWHAIKKVLLSYFGDKSQLQQDLGETKPETENLFLPVLIQAMAGEKPNNKVLANIPTSGVMFSEDPESHVEGKQRSGITKISFTYGHGEAVVNGLLPCDEVTVDPEGVIIPTFTQKLERLIPAASSGLKSTRNPKEIVDIPSLSKEAVLTLKAFGDFLEKKFYGDPVDVEFAVIGNEIHIVQSRPITYKKGETRTPNYFNLEGVDITKFAIKGKVIGTGHKGILGTERKNIIIAKTLRDALGVYLALKKQKKHTEIECVLTENMAPTTSHEATVFRGVNMPVVCLARIDQVKNLKDDDLVIVSPQQALVVFDYENLPNLDIKDGLACYPINEISVNPEWLELEHIKELPEKAGKYHSNSELKKQQEAFLKSIQYYSTYNAKGLDNSGLEKDNPTYLLRRRALELLKDKTAVFIKKTVKAEDRINNEYQDLTEHSVQYMKLLDYAQNDDVTKAWENFVIAFGKLEDKTLQKQFSQMFDALAKYDILPIWLNSFFYKEYNNKYNKDAKSLANSLIRDMKKNIEYLDGVYELRQTIQAWDTNAFEDPKNFDQKYAQFEKLLGKFSHERLYKIFNKDPVIEPRELKKLFKESFPAGLKESMKTVMQLTIFYKDFLDKCKADIEHSLKPLNQLGGWEEFFQKHKEERDKLILELEEEYNKILGEIEEFKKEKANNERVLEELEKEKEEKGKLLIETNKETNEDDMSKLDEEIDILSYKIRDCKKTIRSTNRNIENALEKLEDEEKYLKEYKNKNDLEQEARQKFERNLSDENEKAILKIARLNINENRNFVWLHENYDVSIKKISEETLQETNEEYLKAKNEFEAFFVKYSSCKYNTIYELNRNTRLNDFNEYLNGIKSIDTYITNYKEIGDVVKKMKKSYFEELNKEKPSSYNIYNLLDSAVEWDLSDLTKPHEHRLAEIVWLKCLDKLVDCVDLSIKSLTGSTKYKKDDFTDSTDSQKTQALRFKKLLELNYGVQKAVWCVKNRDCSKESFKRNKLYNNSDITDYTIWIENCFNSAFEEKSIKQSMEPSENFSVIEQIPGIFQRTEGVSRRSIPKTGEDLFTAIHQSTLDALSKIFFDVSKEVGLQVNPYVKVFMDSAEFIDNSAQNARELGGAKLKSIEFKNQNIVVTYNVPLRNHSSLLQFACSKDGNFCELTAQFLGDPGRVGTRWKEVLKEMQSSSRNLKISKASSNDREAVLTWDVNKDHLTKEGLRPYFSAFFCGAYLANN